MQIYRDVSIVLCFLAISDAYHTVVDFLSRSTINLR